MAALRLIEIDESVRRPKHLFQPVARDRLSWLLEQQTQDPKRLLL
jgi:hypothetical protein